jgi:hypothetical protein
MEVTGAFEIPIYQGCHIIGECGYMTATDEKYTKPLVRTLEGSSCTTPRVKGQEYVVLGPAGPGTNNTCVDEIQKQFSEGIKCKKLLKWL